MRFRNGLLSLNKKYRKIVLVDLGSFSGLYMLGDIKIRNIKIFSKEGYY